MTTSIKIWKPYQIFVATYIGGPIGGCYLLYENFRALEEPAKGRFALVFGLFLFAASFLYFTLPVEIASRIPGFIVTLTLVLFIQSYSRFSQEAAIASLEEAGALRHSYKRLFGIAILALFLQWAIAFGIAILLQLWYAKAMEPIIKEAAYFVALLAESIPVLIILLGIIKTVVFYLRSSLPYKFQPEMISTLRMQLGSSLSQSLEFLIGADILKTAISPIWNEIGMLGAIVVIRTVLNYFLMQELKADKA